MERIGRERRLRREYRTRLQVMTEPEIARMCRGATYPAAPEGQRSGVDMRLTIPRYAVRATTHHPASAGILDGKNLTLGADFKQNQLNWRLQSARPPVDLRMVRLLNAAVSFVQVGIA